MNTKFQSKTFMFGFPEGEHFDSFKNDINVLKTFDSSKLEKVIGFVMEIILADTEKEEYKIYNEIVESELIDDPSIISSFEGIVKYFLKKFTDDKTKDDEPKIIVEDIAKKLNTDKEELSTIEKLLSLIKKETKEYEQEKLKRSFEKGLFPFLKGIGTTVELRGIFNRGIEIGESLDSYKKDVKVNEDAPTISVISVAITLDSGTPERFCFQSSPENIEWLIEELKAALYKSKMLEEKFNTKNI